jgi:aryl-alcohol dehydrogenase-like predicted oxidoreductase
MDRFLEIQLKKLRADHIDYYLIHALTKGGWEKIKEIEVLEFLDTAKRTVESGIPVFPSMTIRKFSRKSSIPTTGISARYSTIFLTRIPGQAQKAWNMQQKQELLSSCWNHFAAGTMSGTYARSSEAWNESDIKRTPAE